MKAPPIDVGEDGEDGDCGTERTDGEVGEEGADCSSLSVVGVIEVIDSIVVLDTLRDGVMSFITFCSSSGRVDTVDGVRDGSTGDGGVKSFEM